MSIQKLFTGISLFLFSLALVEGCTSGPFHSLFWKSYEHPTYRFKVKYPRSWEVRKEGLAGSALALVSSDSKSSFRPNLNVVVSRKEADTLVTAADNAVAQMKLIFPSFNVLSRAPTRLGAFPGTEVRGRYLGPEGDRILRMLIAYSEDMQYAVAVTCIERDEPTFEPTFREILNSLYVPSNLSRP